MLSVHHHSERHGRLAAIARQHHPGVFAKCARVQEHSRSQRSPRGVTQVSAWILCAEQVPIRKATRQFALKKYWRQRNYPPRSDCPYCLEVLGISEKKPQTLEIIAANKYGVIFLILFSTSQRCIAGRNNGLLFLAQHEHEYCWNLWEFSAFSGRSRCGVEICSAAICGANKRVALSVFTHSLLSSLLDGLLFWGCGMGWQKFCGNFIFVCNH